MVAQEFEVIRDKNYNARLLKWRRAYIYKLVGGVYDFGEGIIHIEFPDGSIKTSKSKNVAKRLDQILKQLISPQTYFIDKWIFDLRVGRQEFSIEEVMKLNIWVTKSSEND